MLVFRLHRVNTRQDRVGLAMHGFKYQSAMCQYIVSVHNSRPNRDNDSNDSDKLKNVDKRKKKVLYIGMVPGTWYPCLARRCL